MNRKKIEGVVMLALAALCFWLPTHLSRPQAANHKIIVATDRLAGGFFRDAVVLVTLHNSIEAFGLTLNKPGADPSGPALGGPVEEGKATYTLHTLDVTTSDTEKLEDIGIGYTKGDGFIDSLPRKPREYIVFTGYAAWGLEQLEREIKAGAWKVIDYDPGLVFRTDPAKMYEEALKRPASVPR